MLLVGRRDWVHCIDTGVLFLFLYLCICVFSETLFVFARRAEGDTLTVVTRDEPDAPDGWVKCLFGGKEGIVPDNYVEKI